jgi:penicillin-binding protein 2
MSRGNIFSDNVIIQSKVSSKIPVRKERRWWQGAGRVLIMAMLLWIGLFVLGARLFALTVVDGHRYRSLADDNRTRELVRYAPRGLLLDRTGKPLVENIPRFRLLFPCEDKPEELCVKRITKEEGEKLQHDGLPVKNFLEVEYLRNYLYPESTAHVVGYTGEISQGELEDDYYELRKYQRGDQLGKTAAEAVFEDKLRGRNGRELVEVDVNGKILRVLGRDQELTGEDVTLSIDAELSEVVKKAFPKDKKGAVIVSQPSTGEILALYSHPTFSLNNFSLGMTQEEYGDLIQNPDRPMFDRAIGGIYPPASTYKLVLSWAALEEHVINGATTIEDTGVISHGPFQFHNWYFTKYGGKDGLVDVAKAIARSNDIFFYKVGEMAGITAIRDWSKKLGLGTILGIELPGEATGVLPGPEWKQKQFSSPQDLEARNNEWYTGDTYHLSIGQGYLLTTPLQVNAWTNAVANGGTICRPSIVKHKNGVNDVSDCHKVTMEESTKRLLYKGMLDACSPGGTVFPLFNYGVPLDSSEASPSGKKNSIPVACKSGTAEIHSGTQNTHAWMTLFAPIPEEYVQPSDTTRERITNEPEISITVLVEEGGEGSEIAGPVAKEILDFWFSR